VADGGPGISAENQARIFERFERAVPSAAHAGGFGVGLWIVRQLAEAMEGTIAVTSDPGVGSTFCITLPLTRRSANDHDRA
jgi:two-component system, OmpR family, sensor kinase